MKNMAVALALAALVSVAQARSAVALVEPERVVLTSPKGELSAEQARQAILQGGAKKGWVVVSDEPGKVRLKYDKQNKHEVVVDLTYDATGFVLRYVSSVNMKYEKVDGAQMIHPFYNTWVSNLSRSISTEATTLSAAP